MYRPNFAWRVVSPYMTHAGGAAHTHLKCHAHTHVSAYLFMSLSRRFSADVSLGACLSKNATHTHTSLLICLCLSLGASLLISLSRRFSAYLSLSALAFQGMPCTHTRSLLCLSLGVSLFPQTSLAIGLSLTPRNVSVWLAEQEESIAN